MTEAADAYEEAKVKYLVAIHHIDFDMAQQFQLMEKHEAELLSRKVKVAPAHVD